MIKRLIAITLIVAANLFQAPSSISSAIAAPQLLVVLIPENQPFIAGAAQLFDVQITNVSGTDFHSTMAYLQLLVVGDTSDQINTECGITQEDASSSISPTALRSRDANTGQARVPGSTDKVVVSINLSPGQTTTIYAASDLSCPYSTLKAGAYSIVGSVVLLNGAQIDGQVDSNSIQVVIAAAGTATVPIASSTPPAIPSASQSFLQEDVNVSAQAIDFYQSYGQDDLSNGPASATLAKGGRLVQKLDSGGNLSQYIEAGDVSGVFGTPALSQEWYGHYATWEDASGNVTTNILGPSYPTGYHDIHIGPTPAGYSVLIDYQDLLDIPSISNLGIRMEAYLSNSNLLSGTFRSGTAAGFIQYQDPNGDYNFWPSPTDADQNYPGFESYYDAANYNVDFQARNPGSVVSSNVKPIASRYKFNKDLIRRPTSFNYPDNVDAAEALRKINPFKVGTLKLNARLAKVEYERFTTFGSLPSATLRFAANEVSPNRQVWDVEVRSKSSFSIRGRSVPPGSTIEYIIDPQSARILSYTINLGIV